MNVILTRHGCTRMQQRSVSPFVIELLVRFGEEQSSNGATILSFSKKSLKRVHAYCGSARVHDERKLRKTYAVMGDQGELITCGYRGD